MENKNFDIFEIIKNQHKLAQFFFEQNKTIIVFAEENFYCWDVEKTLWLKTKKDRIINKISDYFTKYLDNLYLDNLKASITTGDIHVKFGNALNRVGGDKFTLGICRYCPVLFLNDDFMKNLDFTKHIINFKNGKLNLKNGDFSKRTIIDHYSQCLNYDYDTDIDDKIVSHTRTIFYRICNCDETLYNFVMSFLGYCITGETNLQHFLYILGISASNGKSSMLDIMSIVFNIYVRMIDNEAFEVDYKDRKKQFIHCRVPNRLVYVEEMSKKTVDVALSLLRRPHSPSL